MKCPWLRSPVLGAILAAALTGACSSAQSGGGAAGTDASDAAQSTDGSSGSDSERLGDQSVADAANDTASADVVEAGTPMDSTLTDQSTADAGDAAIAVDSTTPDARAGSDGEADGTGAPDASDETSNGDGATTGAPTCVIPCPPGYESCATTSDTRLLPSCVDLNDPDYGCGATGCTACFTTTTPNGAQGCSGGACTVSCNPGWMDCDGNPRNGCETDVTTAANCGSCGGACPGGQKCSAGACVTSCTPPLTDCGTVCANLLNDVHDCGNCGALCSAPPNTAPSCSNGSCGATTCAAGLTSCSGGCFDTAIDPLHCGSCTTSCLTVGGGSSWCSAGTCMQRCPVGLTACINTPAVSNIPPQAYSCIDTQSDRANCATCGHECAGSCVNGACVQPLPQLIAIATNAIALAVDDTYVYWVDAANGSIVEADKTIASPAAVTLSSGEPQPHSIASDGAYVYWSDYLGAAIMRKPRTGAPSDQVVAAAVKPDQIAVDDTYVYWEEPTVSVAGGTMQYIKKAATAGGGVQIVLANQCDSAYACSGIVSIAIDTANLCFGTVNFGIPQGGECMLKTGSASCHNGTCAGTVPTPFQGTAEVLVTDGRYIASGGFYMEGLFYDNPFTPSGIGPGLYVGNTGNFGGVTEDPNFIYFTGTGATWGGFLRASKCGGGSTILSSDAPSNLAIDDHYVYGIANSTSIVRLPK